MRPLGEDTASDKFMRFVLGAAIGAAIALAILGVHYVIIGHVHAPLLVVAACAVVFGVSLVRRVPRA
jgi:uncharacterized membrane protein YccC